MDSHDGFLKYGRQDVQYRPVEERIKDHFEIDVPLPEEVLIHQATRCMDCGIPFCHGVGCPLNNLIPELHYCLQRTQWRRACEILHATNNFPEITGRVCPAPCEAACTLSVNDEAVLIRHIEYQIAERGFAENWIKPMPAIDKTGRCVAIVGSGPAGLAAAQQLTRAGHEVVVYEKEDRVGGLLRYGIPNFKLDKSVIDRRVHQLTEEGTQFVTGISVGEDISCRYLSRTYDAICVTVGAETPRDLLIPGRHLDNVLFATDYLKQQNRIVAGEKTDPEQVISAKGKIVVVIGGGDTGSDCVGTARRQGAREIYQFEILPEPPDEPPLETPWPNWPGISRTSTSHEEGCIRRWCIQTKEIAGVGTRVGGLRCSEVEWIEGPNGREIREIPGTEFGVKADIVLLAIGFLHVPPRGMASWFGLDIDEGDRAKKDNACVTGRPGVLVAGDATMGTSLVAHAIRSGREAAAQIDSYLKNS
jgi:NAD(P)H-dependent glutamate synthase small subunit